MTHGDETVDPILGRLVERAACSSTPARCGATNVVRCFKRPLVNELQGYLGRWRNFCKIIGHDASKRSLDRFEHAASGCDVWAFYIGNVNRSNFYKSRNLRCFPVDTPEAENEIACGNAPTPRALFANGNAAGGMNLPRPNLEIDRTS